MGAQYDRMKEFAHVQELITGGWSGLGNPSLVRSWGREADQTTGCSRRYSLNPCHSPERCYHRGSLLQTGLH